MNVSGKYTRRIVYTLDRKFVMLKVKHYSTLTSFLVCYSLSAGKYLAKFWRHVLLPSLRSGPPLPEHGGIRLLLSISQYLLVYVA